MPDGQSIEKARRSPRASMTTHNLRRDIIIIVSIKVSIVLLAAFFVFSPGQRPQIDGDTLDHQILNNSLR
jgi:hypothetical protein